MTLTSLDHRRQPDDRKKKARGVVYTPAPVARFLVQWALRAASDDVLEPSAGLGAFVEEVTRVQVALGSPHGAVVAVEIDREDAMELERRWPIARVLAEDFLTLGRDQLGLFDAVVGNPPFIRASRLTPEGRHAGKRMASDAGVPLSAMASSWAHFVIHAVSFLREEGRLAFVVPAELLTTQYGRTVLDFLTRRFGSVTTIVFDEALFRDAEVDAVLVLAAHDGPCGYRIVRLPDAEALFTFTIDHRVAARVGRLHPRPALSADIESVYSHLAASSRVVRLQDVARIDVGVVTGGAAFFVLGDAERKRLGLEPPEVQPYVRGGRQLGGLVVTGAEREWLFSVGANMSEAARRYVVAGETSPVRQGYKVNRRLVWHQVPIPGARPDLLMPAMAHRAPRLVANPDRVLASNLLYFVQLKDPGPHAVGCIAALSLSSVYSLSVEVEGRTYGGGVLKVEPSEAERLLLPVASTAQEWALSKELQALDRLVRKGHRDEAQKAVDQILGIDAERLVWAREELRTRRLGMKLRSGLSAHEPTRS